MQMLVTLFICRVIFVGNADCRNECSGEQNAAFLEMQCGPRSDYRITKQKDKEFDQ
jgi:hypothetical protein